VTLTEVLEVTFGAVNTPPLEIAPALTDQTTLRLPGLAEVAMNC